MIKKIDILNVEWMSCGRDGHIVEPILVSVELLKPDIKIKRVDINLGFFALLWYRPKIMIIANGVGSYIHFDIVKFAQKLGIKVITLNSEGDYIDTVKSTSEFFWGWNKDKIQYEDLQLVWSNRAKNYISNYLAIKDNVDISKIKVSGAVGFDRYSIFDFLSKKDFLSSFKKESFSKIITFAGFGFDWIVGDYYKRNPNIIDDRFGKEYIPIHIKAQEELSEIYYELVKAFDDILFIVKLHPATEQKALTEFSKIFQYLDKLDNILIIKDEIPVDDVINVSDLWIAYESTTCMEAWLLNKTTFLINPCGKDFQRSQIAQGSPIYKNIDEVKNKIDEFYLNGSIEDFNLLEAKRKYIYKEIIHCNDGLNHLRAMHFIVPFLDKKNNFKYKIGLNDIKYVLKRTIVRIVSRFEKVPILNKIKIVKNNVYFYKIYNYQDRKELRKLYIQKLKEKYSKLNLDVTNYKKFLDFD